jgi:hypothetical protein
LTPCGARVLAAALQLQMSWICHQVQQQFNSIPRSKVRQLSNRLLFDAAVLCCAVLACLIPCGACAATGTAALQMSCTCHQVQQHSKRLLLNAAMLCLNAAVLLCCAVLRTWLA